MPNNLDPEIHAMLVKLALLFYVGEKCIYCGKVFETIADLHDVIYAGYQANGGKLACELCWNENNKSNNT